MDMAGVQGGEVWYVTYLGDRVMENRFYLFNVQLPATLDRLLRANPTDRHLYSNEFLYNFDMVMRLWMQRFAESKAEWASTIS